MPDTRRTWYSKHSASSHRQRPFKCGLVAAAAFSLSLISPVLYAADGSKVGALADGRLEHDANVAVVAASPNGGVLTAHLPWLAPVGHRQPRLADVPIERSSVEQSLQDKEIDRKLTICRGC
jgi:hypothetical protein